jgi:hypothetical protein
MQSCNSIFPPDDAPRYALSNVYGRKMQLNCTRGLFMVSEVLVLFCCGFLFTLIEIVVDTDQNHVSLESIAI